MFSAFQKKLTQWIGPLRIITSGKTATALEVNSQSINPANLMDLKVDGVNKFSVYKSGEARLIDSIWFTGTADSYSKNRRISFTDGFFCYEDNGNEKVWFRGGYGVRLTSDFPITWMQSSTQSLVSFSIGPDNDYGHFRTPSIRIYSVNASATSYQRMGLYATAAQALTTTGASVSTTTLVIPKYSQLIGVTTRVMTALGTTNGTTGYLVGDGTDADLWGAMTGTAVGTSSDARDYTALNALGPSSVDRTVTLTAVGGNFDGTGVIDVCAFYLRAEAD